jgi:hypothetical protein
MALHKGLRRWRRTRRGIGKANSSAYPIIVGGMGRAERMQVVVAMGTSHLLQATHRGTPPEDAYAIAAGLLARGSMLLSGLPSAVRHQWHVATAAHRSQLRGHLRHNRFCGGAPDSLLATDLQADR